MFNFLSFFGLGKFQCVLDVLRFSQRGVFKRIDENRELLELLQREAPDFLERHCWVEGWIHSHDEFLTDLSKFVPEENKPKHPNFPRPYPAIERFQQGCSYFCLPWHSPNPSFGGFFLGIFAGAKTAMLF